MVQWFEFVVSLKNWRTNYFRLIYLKDFYLSQLVDNQVKNICMEIKWKMWISEWNIMCKHTWTSILSELKMQIFLKTWLLGICIVMYTLPIKEFYSINRVNKASCHFFCPQFDCFCLQFSCWTRLKLLGLSQPFLQLRNLLEFTVRHKWQSWSSFFIRIFCFT